MADQQQTQRGAQVFSFPRASAAGGDQPVLEAEVVEEATGATETEQTPQEQGQGETVSSSSSPAATPRAVASTFTPGRARPLSVAQAGGRYGYIVSLAAAGAKRLPLAVSDKVLDRVKLAHLREGGTHRGEILPAQRTAYEQAMADRRDRRRRFGKALLVRKTRISKQGWSGASMRETYRPRWETTVPAAAEAVNTVYPHTPLLSPIVNTINAGVGDFLGGLAAHVGDGIAAAASSPGGAFAALGTAAAGVAWQARAEHHDRQHQLLSLMSADGNADLMPDEDADYLTAAFRAAGILKAGTAHAAGQHVQMTGPIVPTGAHWTVPLQLPKGCTTQRVRAKHAELAGALDSDTRRVLILDGDTDRQLTLRVYSRLPFSGSGAEYPLASAATFDVWEGVPFGTDLFDQPVRVDLTCSHSFAGGATRNGKTFSERVKVAAAVLDPHVTISVADFKPVGDWEAIRKVARDYILGTDGDALLRLAAVIDEMQQECSRRMDLLRGSEGQRHGAAGQINRSMARDPELGCGPWVLVVDEVQLATGDPQAGDRTRDSIYLDILNGLDDIARRGAAVGVLLLLSTQKPDGNILKASTWDQISNRFCLSVSKREISETVLGTGAATQDADASNLVDRKQRGAGHLAGATTHEDPYVLTKSYDVQPDLFSELCDRGRAARIELGTLLAAAGGEQSGPGPHLSPVPDEQDQQQGDVEPLTAAEAQLLAALVIYGEADAEWITAAELYREVVDGELGWEVNQTTRTTVGTALRKAGVDKQVRQEQVEGRRTSVTRYRRTDLVAVATSLGAAA